MPRRRTRLRVDHAALRMRARSAQAARDSRSLVHRSRDSDRLSGRPRTRPADSPPRRAAGLPGHLGQADGRRLIQLISNSATAGSISIPLVRLTGTRALSSYDGARLASRSQPRSGRTMKMKSIIFAMLACFLVAGCSHGLSGTYLPKGGGVGNGLVMDKLDFV